jgi:hypothetical protein
MSQLCCSGSRNCLLSPVFVSRSRAHRAIGGGVWAVLMLSASLFRRTASASPYSLCAHCCALMIAAWRRAVQGKWQPTWPCTGSAFSTGGEDASSLNANVSTSTQPFCATSTNVSSSVITATCPMCSRLWYQRTRARTKNESCTAHAESSYCYPCAQAFDKQLRPANSCSDNPARCRVVLSCGRWPNVRVLYFGPGALTAWCV